MNVYTCQICNKEFKTKSGFSNHITQAHKEITPEQYYLKYIGDKGVCKTCGKDLKFSGICQGYVQTYCSASCRSKDPQYHQKIKNKCIQKYGTNKMTKVEQIYKKRKETCVKRYGVQNPFLSEEIINRRNATWLQKYGVQNPMQNDTIKQKLKETCIKKYGVQNPLSCQFIKQKVKETCIKKYGVQNPMQNDTIKRKSWNSYIKNRSSQSYVTKNGNVLHYQSKPQLDYIKQCQNNNIIIYDGDVIQYELQGKKHNYYVDFKILKDGKYQLIQIKGRHRWFYEDIKSGVMKAKILAANSYSKVNNYLPYRMIMV